MDYPQNYRPTNMPAAQRETYPPAGYNTGRNPFDAGRPHGHARSSQPRTWARKPSRKQRIQAFVKKNLPFIICGSVIAAGIIVIVLLLLRFLAPSNSLTVVQQPPTASQVASQLHCTNFKDLGSAPVAGVVDSGSCYIGNVKYAMDTFANSTVRDSWIKLAAPLGVVPKWESSTSVTYKSIKAP